MYSRWCGGAAGLGLREKRLSVVAMDPRAGGITVSAAKFSSDDAATLVQYAIALVDYCRVLTPLRAAAGKQRELEAELRDISRREGEEAMMQVGRVEPSVFIRNIIIMIRFSRVFRFGERL